MSWPAGRPCRSMRPVPSLLSISRTGPRTRVGLAKPEVVDHSIHMRASRLARAQTMARSASTSPLCKPEGSSGRAASRVMAAGADWGRGVGGSGEGRVGEEGRSRGVPDYLKKKKRKYDDLVG